MPTGAEVGLLGFESEQWVAMVAPAAGLPDAIAEKLNHDIVAVLRDPAFAESLRRQGAEVAPSSPAELASFIASESARLKQLIEKTGIRYGLGGALSETPPQPGSARHLPPRLRSAPLRPPACSIVPLGEQDVAPPSTLRSCRPRAPP